MTGGGTGCFWRRRWLLTGRWELWRGTLRCRSWGRKSFRRWCMRERRHLSCRLDGRISQGTRPFGNGWSVWESVRTSAQGTKHGRRIPNRVSREYRERISSLEAMILHESGGNVRAGLLNLLPAHTQLFSNSVDIASQFFLGNTSAEGRGRRIKEIIPYCYIARNWRLCKLFYLGYSFKGYLYLPLISGCAKRKIVISFGQGLPYNASQSYAQCVKQRERKPPGTQLHLRRAFSSLFLV